MTEERHARWQGRDGQKTGASRRGDPSAHRVRRCHGIISGEYFTLAAGVDTTPLFEGLRGNVCECPHWGFVLRGQITTTDASGNKETVVANDLFYWPPGHNVKVDADAEIVMFSPQHEHTLVINHMIDKVNGNA
jgi:hypothetical protein